MCSKRTARSLTTGRVGVGVEAVESAETTGRIWKFCYALALTAWAGRQGVRIGFSRLRSFVLERGSASCTAQQSGDRCERANAKPDADAREFKHNPRPPPQERRAPEKETRNYSLGNAPNSPFNSLSLVRSQSSPIIRLARIESGETGSKSPLDGGDKSCYSSSRSTGGIQGLV